MVSVIIPNYNHALFLDQRIRSVLNQTYQDFEVVILDDCSTDNSREVIESFRKNPKITHIIYNKKNSGSTFKQWKKGLSLAKGEWIWIAESDDACDTNFLEILLTSVNDDNVGLRYCVSLPVSAGNTKAGEPYPKLAAGIYNGGQFLENHLLKQNVIPNASGVIIKKDLLNQVLTDNILHYKLVGDWLVWCKAVMHTKVFFTNTVKNYHRHHANTVRSTMLNSGKYLMELPKFREELKRYISINYHNDFGKRLLASNKAAKYREIGLMGLDNIKQKKYARAAMPIIIASLKPKINFEFIRHSMFWMLKRNNTRNEK